MTGGKKQDWAQVEEIAYTGEIAFSSETRVKAIKNDGDLNS